MIRPPPRSTLFPYMTLFRFLLELAHLGALQVAHLGRQALQPRAGQRDRLQQPGDRGAKPAAHRSEEHTSELQSRLHLVCRLLLEKIKKDRRITPDVAVEHNT